MILVTGATGNTGSFVVRYLADAFGAGAIVALVREGSDVTELRELGVGIHRCNLGDPAMYLDQVRSGDTFVGISNLRHSDQMLPHLAAAGIASRMPVIPKSCPPIRTTMSTIIGGRFSV